MVLLYSLFLFIGDAYAMSGMPQQSQGSGAGQPQPSPLMSFLPIYIIIFFIFYFLVIKPQKKKQAEHHAMLGSIKKNDEVVTTGGIHGVVVNVKQDTVVLRVDEGTKIEFQKSAIASVKKSRES